VLDAIRRQTLRHDSKTFTRYSLIHEERRQIVAETRAKGATPDQTLSRVLQNLRDEGRISFIDDRGTYQLR
jgi:hypothetical protein